MNCLWLLLDIFTLILLLSGHIVLEELDKLGSAP